VAGFDVTGDQPNLSETQGQGFGQGLGQELGKVLPFTLRRRASAAVSRQPQHRPTAEDSDDLAAFEEEDRHIDYRQRTLMNVIAVIIVTLLITVGVWIADTIAAMQKVQDCTLQGRQNCAPIQLPVKK
jgi:hypothetical protein